MIVRGVFLGVLALGVLGCSGPQEPSPPGSSGGGSATGGGSNATGGGGGGSGGGAPSAVCGDGVRAGQETCDGTDLAGQSCAGLGLGTGTLSCAADCGSFDTTQCAVAQPPDEALFQQALMLYGVGRFAEAQVLFDRLWEMYPTSVRHDNAGYLRGRTRYAQLDYAGAVTAFGALRQAHPTSPLLDRAMYWSGRARYALADYPGAIADFQASLGLNPVGTFADNAAYYIGKAYYEQGAPTKDPAMLGQAITAFGAFLSDARYATSTYRPEGFYFLGRSHFLLMAYPQALAAFQSSAALVSQYQDNAQYYVGRCHFEQGVAGPSVPELNQAVASFQAFLANAAFATSPFTDGVDYYLGRSYFALTQYPQAIGSFQAVVALVPVSQYADNALYYEERSYLDMAPQDCVRARAAYDDLLARFPASTRLSFARAQYQASACQATSPIP